MELNAALYDLCMEADGAIYQALAAAQARAAAAPAPPLILQLRAGLAESPGWFLAQASEFLPAPLTAEQLRVRDTYASERIVVALLELMASERWFERDPAGAYHLTALGRQVLHQRQAARRALLADLEPLPPAELGHLAALLARLIEASLASPAPPGSWCLTHSRRRAPPASAPALVRLAHYFDDLNAFRDDAHMAAWQPYGLEGYEWEAFALACGGPITAPAVAEQLAHRGYSPAEYGAALGQLALRGWLSRGAEGAYSATGAGRAVRAQAERMTDSYFYQPWGVLSPAEHDELYQLLCRLRDSAPQAG